MKDLMEMLSVFLGILIPLTEPIWSEEADTIVTVQGFLSCDQAGIISRLKQYIRRYLINCHICNNINLAIGRDLPSYSIL